MKKQPEVTEATKKAFIDSFCKLCKTKSIEKVTIQEITRSAGYNRCTFYVYFNNMQELIKHIENILISRIKENIFDAINNVQTPEKYISSVMTVLKDYENYIEILLINSGNSNFSKRLKSVMVPAFMERYNINKNNKKSKYALEYHLSGVIGLMTEWIVNNRNIPMQQIADVVRIVLREGVLKMLEKPDKSV